MPQDAVLLMALVVALYLYDSMLWLRHDEGVLTPAGRQGWSVGLGARSYQLAGKYPYLPNPLLPHRPLFRASWRLDGKPFPEPEHWDSHRTILRPIAPLVWTMAAAFFVLFPLGFFTRLGDWALIAGILLLYISIIAALAWVWRKRSAFRLSGRQFAALAFEALVCSPFALNMIRRLSGQLVITEDLMAASRRLQTPDEWKATRSLLAARLDEAMEIADEASPRMAELSERRRRLGED